MRTLTTLFMTFLTFFGLHANNQDYTLVLGSGGTKGLAHVGILSELEQLDARPAYIVGSSAGAIVGALYAKYQSAFEVYKILIDLKQDDLIEWRFTINGSFSHNTKLYNLLKEHLGDMTFEELEDIKFVAVATEIETGTATYLNSGCIVDAVMASAALPGIYEPYTIGDKSYIDGGCADPLPINYAFNQGIHPIFVSNICSSLPEKSDSITNHIHRALEIIHQNLALSQIENADVVLKPELDFITSPIDDSQNDQIFAAGKKAAHEKLEELQKTFQDEED